MTFKDCWDSMEWFKNLSENENKEIVEKYPDCVKNLHALTLAYLEETK